MSKRTRVTSFEQGQIHAMSENGMTIRQIAQNVGRSKSAVGWWVKSFKEAPKQRKKVGRKRLVSVRLYRRILRKHKSNRSLSSVQLMRSVNLEVSQSTALRTMRDLKARFIKKKQRPMWKPYHIERREVFGRDHMTWERRWRAVVFTDEKKFNLDGPDGFKNYWHVLGSQYEHFSKRQGGGKSVMVWGGFAYGGKLPLRKCVGTMNAVKYQDLLGSLNLRDEAPIIAGEQFIWQQDNAPCHSVSFSYIILDVLLKFYFTLQAHSTRNWLRERNIDVMDWPSLSPDLNPIENYWAVLKSILYANGKQYSNNNELWAAVLASFRKIERGLAEKLIKSVDNRLAKLFEKKGKYINY